MKTLRILIRLNSVVFIILGIGMAVLPYVGQDLLLLKPPRELPALRWVGVVLAAFGFVLLALGGLALAGERRRLALRLSLANLLIGAVASLTDEQGISLWTVLVPFTTLMAAALAWGALQPEGSEETMEGLSAIPEEVRQVWLRQMGEAAAQEERNRLARDLHDSIKQQLFTINVSTAAAQELWAQDPERAKAALVDVRRSAREAMVEMQALLHQLQPQALASAGLVEALREQCEALGYRTGAEVSLEMGEAIPDERLPPGAQETLFRIAQEALANVARHARARKVRVWLGREGESGLLRVEDDGQGFDPAAGSSGMGLRNLRERTHSLRGMLKIRSAPGAGAKISVRVPLRPPSPQPPPQRSPIEERLEEERRNLVSMSLPAALFWLQRPILSENQDYLELGFALLYFVLVVGTARASTKPALAASRDAAPATVSELHYCIHRNRIVLFLTGTWWAPWYWRFDQAAWWHPWSVAWLAASLVCAGLTIAEVIKLHRASELRTRFNPKQWRGLRLVLTIGISLVILFSTYPRLRGLFQPQPAQPAEILYFLFGAAVLGYLLTRQPSTEGATA